MDCRRNCPHFTGDGILTSLTVLSLFDGISCGQIALARAGITVKQYFASEIDKHAIKVTQSRHPDTIQLGDILELDVSKLPEIDLLIGGSPCQSFSCFGNLFEF
jgi:site-specific DNA-cytosine methylase